MSICRSGIRGAGLGVWTEHYLISGTVFGPYRGKIVKDPKEARSSGYAWEIYKRGRLSHYIDGLDTSVSNWMRYVNCTTCVEQQNLIAFQFRGNIYYRTFKYVKPHTELLVWYGDEYGERLGICQREMEMAQKGRTEASKFAGKKSTVIRSSQKLRHGRKNSRPCQMLCPVSSFRNSVGNKFSKGSEFHNRESGGTSVEKINVGKEKGTKVTSDMSVGIEAKRNRATKIVPGSKKCPLCEYRTAHAGHLRQHIGAVHEGRKPYSCPQCEFRSSLAANLQQHIKEVHEKIKPYRCVQCEYRSSQAVNLQRHIWQVHERIRPFKCPHCDFRSSQAVHLRKHVRGVHERIELKCSKCEFKTSWPDTLRRHTKAKHGEETVAKHE